jgi:UrcA family protein
MTMNTMSPFSTLRRIAATVLCGSLASGVTVVANAAQEGDVMTQVVKYGDLDVSNAQGAAMLYSRIRAAAANVCRPYDSLDFSPRLLHDCMHKAIKDAVVKVDQPALFAVYNAKNGTSRGVILASRTR